MPNPIYDLNPVNWFQIYQDYRTWNTDGVAVEAIPPWDAGQSGSELLAVLVTTPSGRDTWRFGGWLTLKFNTGIDDPSAVTAESAQSYRLSLGEIKLLPVQRFSDIYTIRISPPYWLPDIETKIWAYIGEIIYPEIELLEQINAKV